MGAAPSRNIFEACSGGQHVDALHEEVRTEAASAAPAWQDGICGEAAKQMGLARLRPCDLASAMAEVAWSVQPWDAGSFGLVSKLQDALGNQGHVDLMQHGGRRVAVKQMPNSWVGSGPREFEEQNPHASEQPWCDLGLLLQLNKIHFPYACELLGIFRDEERTYVVTSLATEGDLFAWHASEPKPGPDREALMVPIMAQVFAAVRLLHDLGIAHRDLSLENILLTSDAEGKTEVKIIDFGMSTLSCSCHDEARGKVVYRAPEMYAGESTYDPLVADAFALGVVLYCVAARAYPWKSTRPNMCPSFSLMRDAGLKSLLERRTVRNGNGELLSEVMSPPLVELLEGLLDLDPSRRWGLGELRTQPAAEAGSEDRRAVWDSAWLAGATGEAPANCTVAMGGAAADA